MSKRCEREISKRFQGMDNLNRDNGETLVFIASSVRSGSTLLNLMLGNHSGITSVGELRHFAEYMWKDGLCTCGKSFLNCDLWREVVRELDWYWVETGNIETGMRRLPGLQGVNFAVMEALLSVATPGSAKMILGSSSGVDRSMKVIENCWRIVDVVSKIQDTRLVVDSSKRPEICKLYYLKRPESVKIILLVRDGRGVALSVKMRRPASMRTLAILWVIDYLRWLVLMLNVPRRLTLKVKYERLCENPVWEMQRICKFLEIDYEESMSEPSWEGKHNIGGSPHRFGAERPVIRIDDRWSRLLTEEELQTWKRYGGLLNRYLGY